jgi:hypothetical protein
MISCPLDVIQLCITCHQVSATIVTPLLNQSQAISHFIYLFHRYVIVFNNTFMNLRLVASVSTSECRHSTMFKKFSVLQVLHFCNLNICQKTISLGRIIMVKNQSVKYKPHILADLSLASCVSEIFRYTSPPPMVRHPHSAQCSLLWCVDGIRYISYLLLRL